MKKYCGNNLFSRHIQLGVIVAAFLLFSLAIAGSEKVTDNKETSLEKTPLGVFKIGMAKNDITPDIEIDKVTMHCYFDRHKQAATSIHDSLYAKAVVIEDKMGNLFALVSTDICYVHSEVHDKVVSLLSEHGFNEHNIMLVGTHTHSGPCGYDRRFFSNNLFGKYNPRIFEMITAGISSAIIKAAKSRESAQISYATAKIKGLNRSRRDPAFDVGTGGGPSDISFKPDKYFTDTSMSVIKFKTMDGAPIGLIYNFAAHPTVMSPDNLSISADWPGVASERLEKEMGQSTVAMFINGSLGDAAPNPDWSTVNQEWKEMTRYGQKIADAVINLQKNLQPMTSMDIKARKVRRNFDRLALKLFNGWRFPKGMSKIAYARPDQPLQAARIGNIVFMAVPGEPTTAAGNKLKELCEKDHLCLVTAPANGYLGYFVVKEEWDEGGYAADSCLFGLRGTNSVIDGIGHAYDLVK